MNSKLTCDESGSLFTLFTLYPLKVAVAYGAIQDLLRY